MNEQNRHYHTALDCCRWLAAFAVVVHHVRHLIFAESKLVADKSILLNAIYFVTGLGDEAVIVFFVLSGLLVGGGSLKKFFADRYDARDYAIHRFSRIYTVLIPALFIGGILDLIGTVFFDRSGLYSSFYQPLTQTTESMVASRLNGETLTGNLLMTQYWLVPVLGSNAPLWTLASEWWFYTLFWAILGALSVVTSKSARAFNAPLFAYIGLIVAFCLVLPAHILLWFSIWLIGVGMAFTDKMRFRIPVWAGMAVFGGVLAFVRLSRAMNWFAGMDSFLRLFMLDLIVALGFCILLAALQKIRSFRFGPAAFHQKMAGFSYTTYLVHFPMLMLLAAVAADWFGIAYRQQPTIATGFYTAAIIGLLYAYSYLLSQVTEEKTPQIRRFPINFLSKRPSLP
jgi:peptidoglycan/LPS O-acetylase OafA/YrhL